MTVGGRGGGDVAQAPTPGAPAPGAFAGVAIPDGYVLTLGAEGAVACLAELAHDLARAGFRVDAEPRLATSDLAGRRPLFELEVGHERLLVRRYHHGGLFRWLTGDRFRDASRPFRELAVATHLRAAGVRTPEVLAARARRALGGWRLEVVTRRVPGSIDLGWVLARGLRGELSRDARASLLRGVGELVGALHAQGCRHADLTPNNMLIDERDLAREGALDRLRPWILDLDRAEVEAAPLADGPRRGNLARLYRFLESRGALLESRGALLQSRGALREGRDGPLRRSELVRFFRGYDPGGAGWRADWRAVHAAHRRARGVHSLGRWLDRAFAGERDARSAGSRG